MKGQSGLEGPENVLRPMVPKSAIKIFVILPSYMSGRQALSLDNSLLKG